MSDSSREFFEKDALMNHAGEFGSYGEELACRFYESRKFAILERNFRCRLGEIDIIAENADTIVFAEVKMRKDSSFAGAAEYVTYTKQKRIINAARFWLGKKKRPDKYLRFDVVEIYLPEGKVGKAYINLIDNAFECN